MLWDNTSPELIFMKTKIKLEKPYKQENGILKRQFRIEGHCPEGSYSSDYINSVLREAIESSRNSYIGYRLISLSSAPEENGRHVKATGVVEYYK